MSIDKIAETLGVRSLEEALKDTESSDENQEIIVYEETEILDGEIMNDEVVQESQLARELTEEISRAQKNINKIIEKGMEAFEDLLELSKSAESAKGYEVAGGIMEKLLNANKDLINVAERKRMSQEEGGAVEKKGPDTVQNNLIVTTTEDLLSNLISQQKKSKKKADK